MSTEQPGPTKSETADVIEPHVRRDSELKTK
jgi:hypothetical protein